MAISQQEKSTEKTTALRHQSEDSLHRNQTRSQQPLPDRAKALRLVHELQTRQIEQQMQTAERPRTRDELEAANIDLEAFNYTVAHELRRYLTSINCYCQVIHKLHGSEREEHCQEYLEGIYQGTLAMDQLIETLLAFSNVGNVKLHRQPVDLSSIARSLVSERTLEASACRCTFHITPGILVDADPDLLRIVLDNLIDNSSKYAGNNVGTVIEFNATSVDGQRACFVRDNGPGFDMALAEQLFLPFQRLPGTPGKGYGIGLATVARIIKRHGGRVWAESEIDKGTTIFFTLD